MAKQMLERFNLNLKNGIKKCYWIDASMIEGRRDKDLKTQLYNP